MLQQLVLCELHTRMTIRNRKRLASIKRWWMRHIPSSLMKLCAAWCCHIGFFCFLFPVSGDAIFLEAFSVNSVGLHVTQRFLGYNQDVSIYIICNCSQEGSYTVITYCFSRFSGFLYPAACQFRDPSQRPFYKATGLVHFNIILSDRS